LLLRGLLEKGGGEAAQKRAKKSRKKKKKGGLEILRECQLQVQRSFVVRDQALDQRTMIVIQSMRS